jgi:MerR family transcriptional regulator, copper efflux regulator
MTQSDKHRHLQLAPSGLGRSVERALVGAQADADADDSGELLQVGDLAKATGKTVRALHLYEEVGLLKPATRSEGGYRLYGSESLVRVRWITKLQSLGLSLSEIQEVAREHEASETASHAAAQLRAVYRAKLAEIRAKITQLHELEHELEQSVQFLESCDTSCAPKVSVQSCPTCNRHPAPELAPELVAGARAH